MIPAYCCFWMGKVQNYLRLRFYQPQTSPSLFCYAQSNKCSSGVFFYRSVVSVIGLQDKQTTFFSGPDNDVDAKTGKVGVYVIPVGSSHMQTHAHVSGDCSRKQNTDQNRSERGQSAHDWLRWLNIIKE